MASQFHWVSFPRSSESVIHFHTFSSSNVFKAVYMELDELDGMLPPNDHDSNDISLGQVAMHANDIVATQDHGSEPATTPKTPKIPKIIAVIAATAWCLMFTCVSWCLLMLVVVWLYDYMAIGYMYSKLVHGFQRGLLESCMSRSCALHTIP